MIDQFEEILLSMDPDNPVHFKVMELFFDDDERVMSKIV
jgi:hypothetical protein